MIADFGIIGIGIAAFTAGVVVGWAFTMGAVQLAIRMLLWAISDRRDAE